MDKETDDDKRKLINLQELKKELEACKKLQYLNEELKAYKNLHNMQNLRKALKDYQKLQELKKELKDYDDEKVSNCNKIKEELEDLKKKKNDYQELLKARFIATTTDYLYPSSSKQGKQEKAGGRSLVQIAPKFIPLGNMVRFGGSSRK